MLSATEIGAEVPAMTTTSKISATMSVTISAGVALSSPPFLSSFYPTHASVGSDVTITGNNFVDMQDVTFNGTSATYLVKSDSVVHASIPSGATTGAIDVTTAAGTASSSTDFVVDTGSGATVHVEAENMTLQNYTPQSSDEYSGGEAIKLTSGTGTARTNFAGATGEYDIRVRYEDEPSRT